MKVLFITYPVRLSDVLRFCFGHMVKPYALALVVVWARVGPGPNLE